MINKKGQMGVFMLLFILLVFVIPISLTAGPSYLAQKTTGKDYCQPHGENIVTFHYFDCWDNDEFGDRIDNTVETYKLNLWTKEVIAKK